MDDQDGRRADPSAIRGLKEPVHSIRRSPYTAFHRVEPEKVAKISGILAVAIALLAAGKLSATVAATYSLSAIKDAVAHLQWGGKLLPDAGQI